jgi:hypothetical protein
MPLFLLLKPYTPILLAGIRHVMEHAQVAVVGPDGWRPTLKNTCYIRWR